jgi:hypothetical protein
MGRGDKFQGKEAFGTGTYGSVNVSQDEWDRIFGPAERVAKNVTEVKRRSGKANMLIPRCIGCGLRTESTEPKDHATNCTRFTKSKRAMYFKKPQ